MHACVCVCVRKHSPRLHAALQRLQARLDEVEGLEKQRGAGPTEGATHEGFDSWVSLGGGKDTMKDEHKAADII